MIKMEGAEIYAMSPKDKVELTGESVGFYIFRDMLGRTVIEEVHCADGEQRWIVGSEAVKPFLLVLWKKKEEPIEEEPEEIIPQIIKKKGRGK